jgi:hypothetical protein
MSGEDHGEIAYGSGMVKWSRKVMAYIITAASSTQTTTMSRGRYSVVSSRRCMDG